MEKAQGAEKSKHNSKSDAGADKSANSSEVADENATTEKEASKQEKSDGVGAIDEHRKNEEVAVTDQNIKAETDVEVSGSKVAICPLL